MGVMKRIQGMGMLLAMLSLVGCGSNNASEDSGNSGNVTGIASSLNQAAYIPGTTNYQFAYNSIPNMSIVGAPADVGWNRWAMLHDELDYRDYFLTM